MTISAGVVGWIAIAGAIISFTVWIRTTLKAATSSQALAQQVISKNTTNGNQLVAGPTIGDLTDLLKALSATVDSLVKAGPGLVGLAAAVLFLGIAAWAVGASKKRESDDCSLSKGTTLTIVDGKLTSDVAITCKG